MNLSIRTNSSNIIQSKFKTKEINKNPEQLSKQSTSHNYVLNDQLHNKLLVKNSPISFTASKKEDKENEAFKAQLENFRKLLIEQKFEPERADKAINSLKEKWETDSAFVNAAKEMDKLSIEKDFDKIQSFASFSFKDFLPAKEEEFKPELLNKLKEFYSLSAKRTEIENLCRNDYIEFKEENPGISPWNENTGEQFSDLFDKINEKRSKKINMYGLSPDVAKIVEKAKNDLKIEFKMPDSQELVEYTYKLFAHYKKLGFALPKTVNLINFDDFTAHSKALGLYNHITGEASYNPDRIAETLSNKDKSISKLFNGFKEVIQHEAIGHGGHCDNIGLSAFKNKQTYDFSSIIKGDENQEVFEKFKEKYFKDTDDENKYNLLNLIKSLEKAMKSYKKDPSSEQNFSEADYKNVILPAYNKLQNLNTLIDMAFADDIHCRDYSKINAHELVAVTTQLSNRYQYVPAFKKIADEFGMAPLKDRKALSKNSQIIKSLKWKDDLLDKLINIRTEEGKPLFSGASLAKILDNLTSENQFNLDEAIKLRKKELYDETSDFVLGLSLSEQALFSDYKDGYFEETDTQDYNLQKLIENFDKANKKFENDPVYSKKPNNMRLYKDVVLPVYRKLQNFNTFIDMTFADDKALANKAKTNLHELAAAVKQQGKDTPVFITMLETLGIDLPIEMQDINKESPAVKSLGWKNELLDQLINIRTEKGEPLFSGEALAKVMNNFTLKNQTALANICKAKKDEMTEKDKDELLEMLVSLKNDKNRYVISSDTLAKVMENIAPVNKIDIDKITKSRYDETADFTRILSYKVQNTFKKFKEAYFDEMDGYNLKDLMKNFEEANRYFENKVDFSKHPESVKLYNDIILPVYKQLQNLNTLIDMAFYDDKELAEKAKTDANQLLAVTEQLRDKYQYVPTFMSIVDNYGMEPSEYSNKKNPFNKALKWKDDLLDKLINLRTDEGQPLFSGVSLAKIMNNITSEDQINIDEIVKLNLSHEEKSFYD